MTEGRDGEPTQTLRQDRIVGTVAFVIGVIVIAATATLQGGRTLGIGTGPALFPRALGLLLAIAGVTLALRPSGHEAPIDDDLPVFPPWKALALLVGGLVYLALLPRLGYVLSTALWAYGTALALGVRRPLLAAFGFLAGSVALYLFFSRVASLALPRGLIEGWLSF